MTKQILVCLLALMMAGGVLAAPRGRGNGRMSKAEMEAQKAEAAARSASLTGIEDFVAKHLATAETLRKWTAENVPKAVEKNKAAPNYNSIPPQYRALIEANEAKSTLNLGGVVSSYWGAEFKLNYYKNRIVVYHFKLDSSKMMATFEPVKGVQPFLMIPEKVLAGFPEEDKAWAETLMDIVNENMMFLFDVPFFVPDMEMFKNNEYGGKFIPEKYLITGDKVDALPAGYVKEEERELRKRWGVPIYDVSKVELGKIDDPSGCFYHSEYKKMKVVDGLYLLNFDMIDPKNEAGALDAMRRAQYMRAQDDIALLEAALQAEEEDLKAKGTLTPAKKKVLNVLSKQFQKVIPPAKELLTQSIKNKEFITTLKKPKAKPVFARQLDVMAPAPTTQGTIPPRE